MSTRRRNRVIAAVAAGAVLASLALCVGGVAVYGAAQRETRSPWEVSFDYLSAIRRHDPAAVDRETCERGGQARELARTAWRELDQALRDIPDRDEFTSTSLEVLPGDPKPDGDDRVKVPATVSLELNNVPTTVPGDYVNYEARHEWTLTLEKRRLSWCVLRVDRKRPL